MKKFLITFIVFGLLFILFACGGAEKETAAPTGCTADVYKASAMPLMRNLNRVIEGIDLRSSLTDKIRSLEHLSTQAQSVECAEYFPLKQETLEFAISHTLDGVKLAKAGDLNEANQAIDKAILNAERFNDWSVDMD